MGEYVTPRGVRITTSDVAALAVGYVPVSAAAPAPKSPTGAPKGNASRESWAEHADVIGVEFDPEATRDEIKAAVSAAQD